LDRVCSCPSHPDPARISGRRAGSRPPTPRSVDQLVVVEFVPRVEALSHRHITRLEGDREGRKAQAGAGQGQRRRGTVEDEPGVRNDPGLAWRRAPPAAQSPSSAGWNISPPRVAVLGQYLGAGPTSRAAKDAGASTQYQCLASGQPILGREVDGRGTLRPDATAGARGQGPRGWPTHVGHRTAILTAAHSRSSGEL
jgi:hypothetical protein